MSGFQRDRFFSRVTVLENNASEIDRSVVDGLGNLTR
jgi:hypothetical protein